MNRHASVYKEEAYELLEELETSLLELETSAEDPELIGRIFRAMHTIKGSGAMFGFDDIASFTHELETVYDLVREGKLVVTKQLIDLTLLACDHIKTMLDSSDGNGEVDKKQGDKIISALKELVPLNSNAQQGQEHSNENEHPSEGDLITYHIVFTPPVNIFKTGTNPLLLLNELKELGKCNVTAQIDNVPSLQDLDPENCYISWDITLTTSRGLNAIRDVFIFVEEDSQLTIEVLEKINTKDQTISADATHESENFREDIKPAIPQNEKKNKKRKSNHTISSIRVPSDKLDILVDRVGELVTVQARLTQLATTYKDSEIILIAEQVERLTSELRENTMSLRMLPIGTTFSKFKRLVRDISHELGKAVDLITEGAETELDKTVIERLNDPLVHLIRNCVDHGIEAPEYRESIGKPRRGTIRLSAIHSGANVLIQIKDDGKGLDTDVIRTKAIEKGLITPEAELSEKEIFALIFSPGFSTVDEVSNLSGRGVGMDVVRRTIDDLGGSIEINSQKNIGTEIILKLPLTLAIIEGLLVKIEEQYYIFPLATVEECIELLHENENKHDKRNIINIRGELVPYISLRDHFAIEGVVPNIEQMVITEVNSHKIGFVVDQVIGGHQTVIKSLSKVYRNVVGISGATILGDGTVALVLDVPELIHIAEEVQQLINESAY